jgi:hypothetical protein
MIRVAGQYPRHVPRSRDLELRGGARQQQDREGHTENVNYKGYVHHASKEDPQYEIKSDQTDHVALHKPAALKLLRR